MEINLAALRTLSATNMLRLGNQNIAIFGSTSVGKKI
jgi:hypothetical protein